MLNKLQFSINRLNRMGVIALVCGFALIASACGGAVATAPVSTPITSTEAAPKQSTTIPGATQDVCSLITSAEAEKVMGQPVVSVSPFSDLDSDYGETVFSCFYLGKDLTIVVSRVDLDSAQNAGTILQQQLAKQQAEDKGVVITEESGLGEKAYWTIVEKAGIYTFLKGSNIFVVGLVGIKGDAASYKAALLTLAKSVALKI